MQQNKLWAGTCLQAVHLVSLHLDPVLIDLDSPERVQHPTSQCHLTSCPPARVSRIHTLFMLAKNAMVEQKDAQAKATEAIRNYQK